MVKADGSFLAYTGTNRHQSPHDSTRPDSTAMDCQMRAHARESVKITADNES